MYDLFSSRRVNQHGYNLIGHAKKVGLDAIVSRARAGEFDAPVSGQQKAPDQEGEGFR